MPGVGNHPGQGHVEVDVRPRNRRPPRAPRRPDQPEAVEGAEVAAAQQTRGQPLGERGSPVAQEAVGRAVRGLRVDEHARRDRGPRRGAGRRRAGPAGRPRRGSPPTRATVLAMPARVAGCWPKFRESQTRRTKGWRSPSRCITAAERSRAPSCTSSSSVTRKAPAPGSACGRGQGGDLAPPGPRACARPGRPAPRSRDRARARLPPKPQA